MTKENENTSSDQNKTTYEDLRKGGTNSGVNPLKETDSLPPPPPPNEKK